MQPLGVWLALLLAVGAPPAPPAPPTPPLRVKVLGPRPAPRAPQKAPQDAMVLYRQRCATCHGESGRGDGPAAAGLTVKPRRFTDAFWQDSASDEHLARAIVEGGFAVRRSSAMPAHPDLKGQAAGLLAVVRSFRSPTGSVAVQAVREYGEVLATFSAEADASGAGEVLVNALPKGCVGLLGRVSGRAEPWCRMPLPSEGVPSVLTCAEELASLSAPSPLAPPALPPKTLVEEVPQEPR